MDTSFYTELYETLCIELNRINLEDESWLPKSKSSIVCIKRAMSFLKGHVLRESFPSPADEIYFFKVIKPKFSSQLILFFKIFQIETLRPVTSRKLIIKYFQKEEERMMWFSRKHLDLYKYYRANSSFMDEKLFLRNSEGAIPFDFYGIDADPDFTTSHDYLWAKIAANDLLKNYLDIELEKLKVDRVTLQLAGSNQLQWTASKVSLIELLYSLHSTGVFNNGNVGLNAVAAFLEDKFKVKLGNYYRTFQEIRIRKKNRTQFIDELKDRLIKKMDYDDENPRF